MSGMAKKWAELQKMTDSEIRAAYDTETENTVAGIAYWRDEIQRREQRQDTATMRNLTWVIFFLTLVITGFTIAIFFTTQKSF